MKIFDTFECSGQMLLNSICQFWNDESIPVQILYPSSVSLKITPLYFLSSNNIYFSQKEHIKMKIFETFKCLRQNSSCQFWNDTSIPNSSSYFPSFFIFITHNSSMDFKLIFFLLWIKGSHHPNFETLKCSSENLPYSSHVIFQTTSQIFFKFCHER